MAVNSTILNPAKYAYVCASLIYGDIASDNGLFTSYNSSTSPNLAFRNTFGAFSTVALGYLNNDTRDQIVRCVAGNLFRYNFGVGNPLQAANLWENCLADVEGYASRAMGELYIKFNHKDGVVCLNRNDPMPGLKTPSLRFSALAGEISIAVYPPPKAYNYYVRYFDGVLIDSDSKLTYFDKFSSLLKMTYRPAKVASMYFKPIDVSFSPFYCTLIFVSDESRTFTEQYETMGAIEEVKTVFPWLVIKDGRVLSGLFSGDPSVDPTIVVDSVHATICLPKVPECGIALNTIGCCPDFPGLAKVSYGGDVFDFPQEWAICPKEGLANPIKLIVKLFDPKVFPIIVYGHFDLVSIYVNVYAYNFRYVHLQNNSGGFGLFSDAISVQSQTVKYENQSVGISAFFNLDKDDFVGNPGRCPKEVRTELEFRFIASTNDPTDVDALIYPFVIPIRAMAPQLKNIERSGDSITITTDYATEIIYYSNHDLEKATILLSYTTLGTNQQTTIDISGMRGILFYTIRNYFSDFSKCFLVSGAFEINRPITLLTFKLELLKNGLPYAFNDSSGNSMTFIEINNCTQSSFDNYTVGSDYSSFNYGFKLTFTTDDPSSTMWASVGSRDFGKITSGNTISISNYELSEQFFDSKTVKSLILLLNQASPFIIPFTFYNYSNSAPAGNVVSQPVAVIESLNAYAKFSFNYQYAYKIEYKILNQDNEIIHGPVSKKTIYSTDSVEMPVTTNTFLIANDWQDLKAVVQIFNRVNVYPYGEVFAGIQTSNYARSSFTLSETTPAQMKFYSSYSNSVLSVVPEFTRHGETVYVFLQLYNYNNNEISVNDYPMFISTTIKPKFTLLESNDWNLDVEPWSVTLTKITDYIYSFKILTFGNFNDLNLNLQVDYESIL